MVDSKRMMKVQRFSCCSRWDECQKVDRCIHPGTEEIPAKEIRSACSVAARYEREKQERQDIKASTTVGEKLLILIDGNSLMHRAFHVNPELRSPCGKPTGAIFGTLKMISNLVAGRKPTHLAVAMDGQGTGFRKGIYSEYKANRKPPDDRLKEQLSFLPEVLEALNIRCISVPEYEADDVLGTMAGRAEAEGFNVLILSGDGDLIQLISEKTTVLLSKKGVSELLECTPATSEYHTGLMPAQVTSYKALAGDSSDNIPGAAGIGKVTAMQLLKDYGYVENILSIVDRIPGKTGEKLRASIDNIKLSLKLATISRDVPFTCVPDDCRINIDLARGTQILSELGISSINLLLFKLQEKVKRTRKADVAKVILRNNGGKDYCGVCGQYGIPCGKFAELHEGKINIMGQQFWACEECKHELINPEYYKKIYDSETARRPKTVSENKDAHIQPSLFV